MGNRLDYFVEYGLSITHPNSAWFSNFAIFSALLKITRYPLQTLSKTNDVHTVHFTFNAS